ncbi:MAG: hypothetical protein IJ215_00435 [Clostridia bacterium]|nr:hypothetical protein [Clostridia bacterium]
MKGMACGTCYFDSYGLWVDKSEYDVSESTLYTNVWPTGLSRIRNAVEPEFEEIDLIEVGETGITIYMLDIGKKDAQSYVNSVKKVYTKSVKNNASNVLYTGLDEGKNKVTVKYNADTKELRIIYKFEKKI